MSSSSAPTDMTLELNSGGLLCNVAKPILLVLLVPEGNPALSKTLTCRIPLGSGPDDLLLPPASDDDAQSEMGVDVHPQAALKGCHSVVINQKRYLVIQINGRSNNRLAQRGVRFFVVRINAATVSAAAGETKIDILVDGQPDKTFSFPKRDAVAGGETGQGANTGAGSARRIVSFAASATAVKQYDKVVLNWALDPNTADPASFIIAPTPEKPPTFSNGMWAAEYKVDVTTKFILLYGKESREINVHVGENKYKYFSIIYKSRSEKSEEVYQIFSLFNYANRLYAIVRREKNSPTAEICSTSDDYPTGKSYWVFLENAPTIPLSAAARPCAILNDQLYLIGGDCCDANARKNTYYRYDLPNNKWSQELPAHENFPEVYGHRVIAAHNKLWIAGGFTDSGPLDAIWSFDGGSTWERYENTELTAGLAASVATHKYLWIAGGQKNYGGDAVNDVFRYDFAASTWRRSHLPIVGEGEQFFCGGALMAAEGRLFSLAVSSNANQQRFGQVTGELLNLDEPDPKWKQRAATGWDFPTINGLWIGAVTFRGLPLLWTRQPDDVAEPESNQARNIVAAYFYPKV